MSEKRVEVEYEEYIDDLQEIDVDDYCFVFSPDGTIKAVFVPEHLPFKLPKNITKIIKALGITNLEQFNEDVTIH
ncbi:hypothetical protein UFOVP257_162 [uncultured Caudovirales phage]|uniref:Uncharacterized protein n=1 Tax=uncultured Caudovirales phage TaxID=2100421 RepID=A0A6J5LJX4_9CAUD|nr:hypothetical protein UFOVP257_162 [uncultured Caudovirales phage]